MSLSKSRAALLAGAALAVGFSACLGDDPALDPSRDATPDASTPDGSASETSSPDVTQPVGDATVDGSVVDPKCPAGKLTTIRGTVYDPAGNLPVANAQVFVPGAKPAPIQAGVSCDRCAPVAGALASTRTKTDGTFVLEATPAGKVPVVIQIGKWRRQIEVDGVVECEDHPITDKNKTRLPRNKGEGDIPRIAMTTGAADAVECLLRKVGIDDSEFSTKDGAGRVHLYAGPGSPTSAFSGALGGASFASAVSFWNDVNALKAYDLVILSCEGVANEASKPAAARQAMFDYANAGGRIFATHDQAYWFSAGPSPFPTTATWVPNRTKPTEPLVATIDTSTPRTMAMRDWAQGVAALSAPPASMTLLQAQHDVDGTNGVSQAWMTFTNANASNAPGVQLLTFEAPVGVASAQQCGRVAHTAMHVAAGESSGPAFPSGCTTSTASAQAKLFEYMLFHLSSCLE